VHAMLRLSRSGFAVLAALLLVAACRGGETTPPPSQGASNPAPAGQQAPPRRVVTIAQGTDQESWNPYFHSSTPTYGLWFQIMEPLVVYDLQTRSYRGVLATSWENPEPNLWVFHLRQGVKAHNGQPFTAQDVVYSVQRIKDPQTSRQAFTLRDVERVEAVDDYTVRFYTKQPFAPFLDFLTTRVMITKSAADQWGDDVDRHPTGTGPFRFKEWVPGQRWVVERNPDYWGPQPDVDEVIFRPIPEDEARITALLNGEVDIITNVPPQALGRLTGQVRAEGVRGLRIMFLALNNQLKPFDNKLVRQAVNYAIDRDALIKGVLDGRAYRLDGPVGPQVIGYDDKLTNYPYDPAKARELLAQAGYPDGFSTDLYTPTGRYTKDKEVTQAIAGQLAQVGIKTNIRTPEWATYFSDVDAGKLPMYYFGRGPVTDPSDFFSQYFETGVSKRIGFSLPALDALLRQERETFDPNARVQILQQAQRLMMEEAGMAFLWNYEDTYGVGPRVDWKPRADEYVFGWEIKLK